MLVLTRLTPTVETLSSITEHSFAQSVFFANKIVYVGTPRPTLSAVQGAFVNKKLCGLVPMSITQKDYLQILGARSRSY